MEKIFIKLLALIDKKKHQMHHAEGFKIGIFSINNINNLFNLQEYKIKGDMVITPSYTNNLNDEFADYDLIVLLKKDTSYSYSIRPLNQFVHRSFPIHNSCKCVLITTPDDFYIPQQFIYNKNYIYSYNELGDLNLATIN